MFALDFLRHPTFALDFYATPVFALDFLRHPTFALDFPHATPTFALHSRPNAPCPHGGDGQTRGFAPTSLIYTQNIGSHGGWAIFHCIGARCETGPFFAVLTSVRRRDRKKCLQFPQRIASFLTEQKGFLAPYHECSNEILILRYRKQSLGIIAPNGGTLP